MTYDMQARVADFSRRFASESLCREYRDLCADLLARIAALEAENAELNDEITRKDCILYERRKEIQALEAVLMVKP